MSSLVSAVISYVQRDLPTILDNLQQQLPSLTNNQWTDFTDSDVGYVILKTLVGQYILNSGFINSAVGECFLSTCQLRESAVRIAKMLGYTPARIQSSTVDVTISFPAFNSAFVIPAGTLWTINNQQFTNATAIGINAGQTSIGATLTQGTPYTPTAWTANGSNWYEIAIPNNVANIAVAVNNVQWTEIDDWTAPTTTTVYKIYENPNNTYSIIFGATTVETVAPTNTSQITVTGISSVGAAGNTSVSGLLVTPASTIRDTNGNEITNNFRGITTTLAVGGADAETIQSIKQNAPALYPTQNRLVTAADFQSYVLSLPEVTDCVVFGGQDPRINRYGEVHMIAYSGNVFSTDPSFLDYVQSSVASKCVVTITPVVEAPVAVQMITALTAYVTQNAYAQVANVNAEISSAANDFYTDQGIADNYYQSQFVASQMANSNLLAVDVASSLFTSVMSSSGSITVPLCANYDVSNCKLVNAAGTTLFTGNGIQFVSNGAFSYQDNGLSDQQVTLYYGFTGQDITVGYNQIVTLGQLSINMVLP